MDVGVDPSVTFAIAESGTIVSAAVLIALPLEASRISRIGAAGGGPHAELALAEAIPARLGLLALPWFGLIAVGLFVPQLTPPEPPTPPPRVAGLLARAPVEP